jgi:hypothetical protein
MEQLSERSSVQTPRSLRKPRCTNSGVGNAPGGDWPARAITNHNKDFERRSSIFSSDSREDINSGMYVYGLEVAK